MSAYWACASWPGRVVRGRECFWQQDALGLRGLFFTLCIDTTDNELMYFESIHLFVELLCAAPRIDPDTAAPLPPLSL